MMNKVNPYNLKVTDETHLPIKLYHSNYLKQALGTFTIAKKIKKNLKKLFRLSRFRKSFVYLFWIFIALKFTDRTFGNYNHFNGDANTRKLKKDRFKLYRLLEEDIALGYERRINFIKYWRYKF